MTLQEVFYLTNIITQVLLSFFIIFLIIALWKIFVELRYSLDTVRQSALVAQQKSIISFPPLNSSVFVVNFIKNLLSKK